LACRNGNGWLCHTQGRRNILQENSFQMSHGRMHCPLDHYKATNSFERPERIAARASRLEDAGAKFSYTFPAYSVTLIRLSIQE